MSTCLSGLSISFSKQKHFTFFSLTFFFFIWGAGKYEEASTHNQCMVVQGLLLEIFGQLGYTVLCLGLSIYCGGPAVLGVTRYTLVASGVSRVTPGGDGVGEWGSGRLQGSNSGSCVYKYVSLSLELSPRHPFSPTLCSSAWCVISAQSMLLNSDEQKEKPELSTRLLFHCFSKF